MVTDTSEITYRAVSISDLERCVALFNKRSRVIVDRDDFATDDVREEWTSPGFSLAEDTRLAEDAKGRLIGYAEVWNTGEPYVNPYCWVCIDPDVDDDGISNELFGFAKSRALEKLHCAPQDARVILQTGALEPDTQSVRRIQALGMEELRRYYRMEITLDGAFPVPETPEGYTIRSMRSDEERAVFKTVDEAFKDHYGHPEGTDFEQQFTEWKHFFTENGEFDPELVIVAESADSAIVGTSVCWPREGTRPDVAWVAELGVIREHRKRGIAEALLRHSFHVAKTKDKSAVGLGVDATSLTGATRLYEKCGMEIKRTSILYFEELRPGVEYRKQ